MLMAVTRAATMVALLAVRMDTVKAALRADVTADVTAVPTVRYSAWTTVGRTAV
jgi:hypothetical protein